MSLFKLRGPLSSLQSLVLGFGGFLFILLFWHVGTTGSSPFINPVILPPPGKVFMAFLELFNENELFKNVCRSLGYNFSGYVIALAVAIPLGFLIGLIPFFRGTLQRPIDAIRFLPLPAAIGIFMAAFDLGAPLIVNFLAFGILIYLIPVIVQRIEEVNDVYLKTVYTLGASDWQTIKTVYFPSVVSRLSDDVRILTAISWTYITVAEVIGGEGGIGALAWRVGDRFGRYDKVYAILITIIIIGVLQDRFFAYLDKEFFPFKYQASDRYKKQANPSVWEALWTYAGNVLAWVLLGVYAILLVNQFAPFLTSESGDPLLTYLFGRTAWVMHLIFAIIFGYKLKVLCQKYILKE